MIDIDYVCASCGDKYGRRPADDANSEPSWVRGYCEICHKHTVVTGVRTYGYLDPKKLGEKK